MIAPSRFPAKTRRLAPSSEWVRRIPSWRHLAIKFPLLLRTARTLLAFHAFFSSFQVILMLHTLFLCIFLSSYLRPTVGRPFVAIHWRNPAYFPHFVNFCQPAWPESNMADQPSSPTPSQCSGSSRASYLLGPKSQASCGHFTANWDSHPLCFKCRFKSGLRCTRQNACEHCQAWPESTWTALDAKIRKLPADFSLQVQAALSAATPAPAPVTSTPATPAVCQPTSQPPAPLPPPARPPASHFGQPPPLPPWAGHYPAWPQPPPWYWGPRQPSRRLVLVSALPARAAVGDHVRRHTAVQRSGLPGLCARRSAFSEPGW